MARPHSRFVVILDIDISPLALFKATNRATDQIMLLS